LCCILALKERGETGAAWTMLNQNLKMKFNKVINNNIIAVLGTWDPLLPRHKALFKKLLSYGKKNGLNPYVIIVYPNPGIFIYGNVYTDYFDLPARIELLKYSGINNVLVLDIGRDDLRAGAEGVFNELFKDSTVTLKELWIGENQWFGTGDKGAAFSTAEECLQRNIKLRLLKNSFLVNIDKDNVNRDFRAGKFDQAAAVVGHFPTYKLNGGMQIKMCDGIYKGRLRPHPFQKTNEIAVTVHISNEKLEEIKRADGYDWLVLLEKLDVEEPKIY
jgi:FAD synthase